MSEYCDSLSCLHALEHFGLGRYNDAIDPNGFERGLINMSRLLKNFGIFYLSVPIGIARVEFNAHRVFDPQIIYKLALDNNLQLINFNVIYPQGNFEELKLDKINFEKLAKQNYALGIFTFKKQIKTS